MRYPLARARAVGASHPPSGRLRKGRTECYRQLIRARKLAQMPQCEMLQEQWRGAIQQRTPHPLAATNDVHETALLERLENRARADTANVLDLHSANRLAIRNYRECLQRRARQTLRPRRELRALDRLRVFRTREYLPPVAHSNELHAVALVVVTLANFIQRRRDGGGSGFRIQLTQCVRGNRARTREERGFQQSS